MPIIGIYALVVASIFAAGFGSGWIVNGWRHDAKEKIQVEAHMTELRKRDAANRRLSKQFQEATAHSRIVYRTIEKKVENETDNRVCFNAGAISLWNSALLPTATPGIVATAARTDTATDRDVLGNAVENAEQYKECRDQLNALIDWHDSYSGR